MSKQSDAKKLQEYVAKPNREVCMNCRFFKSDEIDRGYYIVEKNLRCSIGGFAIKKMATCKLFSPLPAHPNV